jgi:hypothetical protein
MPLVPVDGLASFSRLAYGGAAGVEGFESELDDELSFLSLPLEEDPEL